MARIEKYATGIVGVIKHNIREFKDGKCPTNMEVNPEKSCENYSIIRRGKTAREIEKYRKSIEHECFHYNRKNIIHANEVICTLPADCPPEQEKAFFEESYKYICSTLPMGDRCIFLAEVHCDEGRIAKDGETVVQGQKHLHVMYVPAVQDSKHEGYDYKLCSDQLTRRAILKQWHPNYQKWLDDAGIQATVASGVTTGKGISVKSMKEISKETGLSIGQIKSLEKENEKLRCSLMECKTKIDALQDKIKSKENDLLKEKLQTNSLESQIHEKELQLLETGNRLSAKELELEQAKELIRDLETRQKTVEVSHPAQEHTWGNSSWGTDPGWGTSNFRTYEEEKTW